MTKHSELQARLNAAVRKTWVERDGRLIGTPESCSGFSRECREVAADALTALAAAESRVAELNNLLVLAAYEAREHVDDFVNGLRERYPASKENEHG